MHTSSLSLLELEGVVTEPLRSSEDAKNGRKEKKLQAPSSLEPWDACATGLYREHLTGTHH